MNYDFYQKIYILIGIHINMAKQIFISDEAYRTLLTHKGEHDSFSNVILRKFKTGNFKKIIDRIKKNPLDKTFSLDKNILNKGWKQWRKSLMKLY